MARSRSRSSWPTAGEGSPRPPSGAGAERCSPAPQRHDPAVGQAENLHLDMPCGGDEALHQQRRIGEEPLGPAARGVERGAELLRIAATDMPIPPPPALWPSPSPVPDALSLGEGLGSGVQRNVTTGRDRHPAAAIVLRAPPPCRPSPAWPPAGSDPDQARGHHPLGEVRALLKKPYPGWIASAPVCRAAARIASASRTPRARAARSARRHRVGHERQLGVSLRVDGDGGDAHGRGRADDPAAISPRLATSRVCTGSSVAVGPEAPVCQGWRSPDRRREQSMGKRGRKKRDRRKKGANHGRRPNS